MFIVIDAGAWSVHSSACMPETSIAAVEIFAQMCWQPVVDATVEAGG